MLCRENINTGNVCLAILTEDHACRVGFCSMWIHVSSPEWATFDLYTLLYLDKSNKFKNCKTTNHTITVLFCKTRSSHSNGSHKNYFFTYYFTIDFYTMYNRKFVSHVTINRITEFEFLFTVYICIIFYTPSQTVYILCMCEQVKITWMKQPKPCIKWK